MFLPIKKILNNMGLDFDNILKDDSKKEYLLNEINVYYKINLTTFDNIDTIDDLEYTITKLTNSHSIMFHHFHNNSFKKYAQGSITEKDLEDIILKIGRENILNGDVWLEKYKNGELKKGETCFTFDDGLLCQYKVALPILEKYKIKALWFIYTKPITGEYEFLECYKYFVGNNFDNFELFYEEFFELCQKYPKFKQECNDFNEENDYVKFVSFYTFYDRKFRYIRDKIMSKEEFNDVIKELMKLYNFNLDNIIEKVWINKNQLINLNKSQIIGIHSHTHPTIMEDLNYNQQFEEYKRCKDILENILKKEINILSYPCGKYNSDTFDVLKKLNIKYSFISYLSIPTDYKNYLIQREDHMNFINYLKK